MSVDVSSPAFVAFHTELLSHPSLDVHRKILEEIQKHNGRTTLQVLATLAHAEFTRGREEETVSVSVHSFGHDMQHMIIIIQRACVDLFQKGKNPSGFVPVEDPATPVQRKDDDLSTHIIAWDERLERMEKLARGERRAG